MFDLVWEDLYMFPHAEEEEIVEFLSGLTRCKYLGINHCERPERLQQLLPQRRVFLPEILRNYPLFESEGTVFSDLLLKSLGPDFRPLISASTDAQLVRLFSQSGLNKQKTDYRAEIRKIRDELAHRSKFLPQEIVAREMNYYYLSQALLFELKRRSGLISSREASVASSFCFRRCWRSARILLASEKEALVPQVRWTALLLGDFRLSQSVTRAALYFAHEPARDLQAKRVVIFKRLLAECFTKLPEPDLTPALISNTNWNISVRIL